MKCSKCGHSLSAKTIGKCPGCEKHGVKRLNEGLSIFSKIFAVTIWEGAGCFILILAAIGLAALFKFLF